MWDVVPGVKLGGGDAAAECEEAGAIRHAEAQGGGPCGEAGIREAERSQGERCGVHPRPLLRRSLGCLFPREELAINVVYTFLRRTCRGPSVVLHIPQENTIEIGVVYRV